MTSEEAAFLKAIRDNPADNTARLVYADWLQENGNEPRAEFIRVQIALAVKPPGPEEARKASNLLIRFRRGAPVPLKANTTAVRLARSLLLQEKHGQRWREESALRIVWGEGVKPPEDPTAAYRQGQADYALFKAIRDGALFTRGFVSRVSLTESQFTAHCYSASIATKLFREWPLEVVSLSDREPLRFENRFLWHNGDSPLTDDHDYGDHLSSSLFAFLEGSIQQRRKVRCDIVKSYRSRDEANTALADAALRWGKAHK